MIGAARATTIYVDTSDKDEAGKYPLTEITNGEREPGCQVMQAQALAAATFEAKPRNLKRPPKHAAEKEVQKASIHPSDYEIAFTHLALPL